MNKNVDSKKKNLPQRLGKMDDEFLVTKVMFWATVYEDCAVHEGKLPYVYPVKDAPALYEAYNDLSPEDAKTNLLEVFSTYEDTDCAIFSAEENKWLRLTRANMRDIRYVVTEHQIEILKEAMEPADDISVEYLSDECMDNLLKDIFGDVMDDPV